MAEQPPMIVPPMVYLPVHDEPDLEKVAAMRPLADGRIALLAFSALDRLIGACGPHQEWVVVHLSEITQIKQRTPFDAMVLDPAVPAEAIRNGRSA